MKPNELEEIKEGKLDLVQIPPGAPSLLCELSKKHTLFAKGLL
jgi:hypothetical protein